MKCTVRVLFIPAALAAASVGTFCTPRRRRRVLPRRPCCRRDREHLLVGEDVLERVGQPVDRRPLVPGDHAEMLTLEVELHLAAADCHGLVWVVEERWIGPARALEVVVLA